MKSGGYEMTINERLGFFKEMLLCNYDVYLWTYTPELELIHTNCPQDLVISDASSILDFADTLQEYITSGNAHRYGWIPLWVFFIFLFSNTRRLN